MGQNQPYVVRVWGNKNLQNSNFSRKHGDQPMFFFGLPKHFHSNQYLSKRKGTPNNRGLTTNKWAFTQLNQDLT